MLLATVLLASLMGQVDPADLVKALGSSRFAERESAYEELSKLGSTALNALRSASSNADAEVRARVSELIDKIEARLLVEPTLVSLDFHDSPLASVIEKISERTRTTIQISFPDGSAPGGRRITLESDAPVPFWTAVSRICELVDLDVMAQPMQLPNVSRQGPFPLVHLLPRNDPLAPASVSGPFRVSVINVSHHRDRAFGQGAFNAGVFLNPNRVQARPRNRPGDAMPGRPTESFAVSLQIQAEPRLGIIPNGAFSVLEARDDRGRSLKPDGGMTANSREFLQPGAGGLGQPVILLTIPLDLPDEPSRLIRELRAEVPVRVVARKNDPFVIDLREAKGKTFENKVLTVKVHDVRQEAMLNSTIVEMTVRFRREESANPNGQPFGNPEFQAFRSNPGQPGGPVEFVDAQGRLIPQWFLMEQRPGLEGLTVAVRVQAGEGFGAPAELRFYEQAQADTTVSIRLQDIPMP